MFDADLCGDLLFQPLKCIVINICSINMKIDEFKRFAKRLLAKDGMANIEMKGMTLLIVVAVISI